MIRLVSILLTSLFLANCGGGGSDGVSTAVKQTTNLQEMFKNLIGSNNNHSNISSTGKLQALLEISNDDKKTAKELKGIITYMEEIFETVEGWNNQYYNQTMLEIADGKTRYEWFEISNGGYLLLKKHEKLIDYLIDNPDIDDNNPLLVNFINDEEIKNLNDKTEDEIYAEFKNKTTADPKWKWAKPINEVVEEEVVEETPVEEVVEEEVVEEEVVEEEVVEEDNSLTVIDTYVTNVEEQTVTQGDDVVTTATTTRTETENTDDATVTRTYQVVTTTTRTPTHTTTTLTPKTVTVWSDGTETFVLGTPVTETVTTWAESSTSEETLVATNSVPIGSQFLTDEYNLTALDQINASYAYDRGYTGDGVVVGIIDSGIDTDHEDLDSDRFSTINYRFAGTEDDNGHGTHVAGIIASTKNDSGIHGVAYDADVISIKLCFAGGNCSASFFDEAMIQLSNQGVTVANLSANTSTNILTQIGDTDAYYIQGQSSMDGVADGTLLNYQTAVDNGMIIVNSAGNYGLDYPMMPSHYATRVDENGELYLNGQWLIVGAVDSNNNIASWSNKAGHICSNVTYTDGVATGCDDTFNTKDFFVVAPGVNILSTANGGGTTTMSGTSMAAPYVTGSIAVLKQAWPQLEPEQLVGLITSTAQDLGDPGVDSVYGHGVVDLNEATKPQGDIVAVQPSGNISQVSGGIIGDSSLSGLDDIVGLSSIMVFDSYQRDYYVDDKNFTQFEIVERSLTSSFAGYEHMETLTGDGMTFAMSNSGDDWQYGHIVEHSDNLDVTYNVGMVNQDGSLYGSSFQGLFAIDSSQTQFVGMDMTYSITDSWNWIGSYHRGFSQINSARDSYITGSTDIQSQTWYAGVSYAKNNDSFDLKFGEQLGIVQGSINYNLPTSYDWQTDTTEFTSGSASAQSSQTPKVIELAYNKQLTQSWNFNTNSRYTFVSNDNILTANIGVEYTW